MTLHHQLGLLGPGHRGIFGLRAFGGGNFFVFDIIINGQGPGKGRNSSFLSGKFRPSVLKAISDSLRA